MIRLGLYVACIIMLKIMELCVRKRNNVICSLMIFNIVLSASPLKNTLFPNFAFNSNALIHTNILDIKGVIYYEIYL